jgi:predicted ester cyclase
MGIAATGKSVVFDAFQIDQIADGKVVQRNATGDLIAILAQLGAIAPRPTD